MAIPTTTFLEHPNDIYYALVASLVFILLIALSRTTKINHSFKKDIERLKRHTDLIILRADDKQLAIAPELQGRVLIATSNGFKKQSIGWINRDYLSKRHDDIQGIGGGADRLWLGPDGGKFSVFFEPGAETTTDNIRVPPNFANTPFKIKHSHDNNALFESTFSFSNHLGFEFNTSVERLIELFDNNRNQHELGISISKEVAVLGYGSNTTVSNVGTAPWSSDTGLFSIWSLSTFAPRATIAIPLKKPLKKVTNYFTPASNRQTVITDNAVFYHADANFMNKIGIPAEHTLPFIGSYDHLCRRLTIIKFQISNLGAGYTNAVWNWDADPLDGEIVNIFNDGVQENGDFFGPLYEIETSSAALALNVGQSHSHYHYTFHFTGPESELDIISNAVLGVSIEEFKKAF